MLKNVVASEITLSRNEGGRISWEADLNVNLAFLAHYPALTLGALGLLLADSAPSDGGKTFFLRRTGPLTNMAVTRKQKVKQLI